MRSPSIIAVIQVRMSSNRLPRKAMRLVGGRALLGHVVDRVRRCQSLDGLSIATSTRADDNPVVAFAEAEGVMVHRGVLDDVAGRLLEAGRAAGAEAIVRISADSPLIDPEIVDHAVSLFRRERPDVVSNVVRRTFPKGQSVEVIRLATLKCVHSVMTRAEREHVTKWFYAHPTCVRILGFEAFEYCGDLQLSVDILEDLARIEAILARLGEPAWSHGLTAILAAAKAIESAKR
jgi:spore coat polysaccharide biosynthesis protein SpsF